MNPVTCLCDPWEACGFIPTSNAGFVPDTNSDASVRFRTLPSDLRLFHAIRFWTLSSDSERFCRRSSSDSGGNFPNQTHLSDFGHYCVSSPVRFRTPLIPGYDFPRNPSTYFSDKNEVGDIFKMLLFFSVLLLALLFIKPERYHVSWAPLHEEIRS